VKVKISQTLSLEEVPDLVMQIVGQCQRSLLGSADLLRVSMHDVPSSIERTEKVIRDVALTVEKLQDVINIASGWYETTHPTQDNEVYTDEESE